MVTSVEVPRDFPWLSPTGIASGQPVRALLWGRAAHAINWLLAAGVQCIPQFASPDAQVAAGATATYHVMLVQTQQAKYRMWLVSVRADSPPGTLSLTFTDASGGPHTYTVTAPAPTADTDDLKEIGPIFETITSRTAGIVAATFSIASAASSTKATVVEDISCFEMPRGRLNNDATDQGLAPSTILGSDSPGPITAGDGYSSLGAIIQAHYAAFKAQPRTLFVWARPANQGVPTTSATFEALFIEGPPCLGTKLYRTSTTIAMTVYAYVRTSASTTGELRVTMTNGSTTAIAIPTSTAGAWVSGTVNIDCEDLTASDGRRASRDDIATIELRRVSGAGTVYLETVQGIEVRP